MESRESNQNPFRGLDVRSKDLPCYEKVGGRKGNGKKICSGGKWFLKSSRSLPCHRRAHEALRHKNRVATATGHLSHRITSREHLWEDHVHVQHVRGFVTTWPLRLAGQHGQTMDHNWSILGSTICLDPTSTRPKFPLDLNAMGDYHLGR